VERSVDAHLSPEELDVDCGRALGSEHVADNRGFFRGGQHLAICEICRSTIEFHAEEEGRMRNMRSACC